MDFLKEKIQLITAFMLTIPWIISFFLKIHYPPQIEALISGFAVVGAAFLLSWASETAEMDVPRSLSLAVVALLAVLPEYAVDAYFTWMAGKVGGEYIHYATANMTGANRLLIGIGWSIVMFIAIFKSKKRYVELDDSLNLEIFFLFIATLYSFILPIKDSISLMDSFVFVSLYILYVFLAYKAEHEEFEPEGVPKFICQLETRARRFIVMFLMIFAAFVIFISVEAFSEGLLGTAKMWGIDEFLVVQWIAPLASESAEFIVAIYLVKKMRVSAGLNALISSKVNQWTLLIGTLAVVYSISLMEIAALPLDVRQRGEIFLTAAQSLFATALILDKRVTLWEAFSLFFLFLVQIAFPSVEVRYLISLIYLILAIFVLMKNKKYIPITFEYVKTLATR
uniref:Sodium:calcium antiporter n=1 Tax=Geoglobus ahangari TaxID=113653 RepID=A0A7C3YGU8_9EURY